MERDRETLRPIGRPLNSYTLCTGGIMQTRDVLGFILIPLVLLLAAWFIDTFHLWDSLANMTLPWLCTAIAISILLLGAVCVILQVAPAAVLVRVSVMVVVGTLVIFGVGMIVDRFSYAKPVDWLASIGGWIGFAVVLSGVFALPRVRPPTSA
jgi:hypothetical protein